MGLKRERFHGNASQLSDVVSSCLRQVRGAVGHGWRYYDSSSIVFRKCVLRSVPLLGNALSPLLLCAPCLPFFAWPQRRAAACALVFLHKWLFATLPQALILCRVDIVSNHSNRAEVSTFLTGLLFHQAVFPRYPSRAAAGALVFLHNNCHRGR